MDDDDFLRLSHLADDHEAPREKRATCNRCGRPMPTCWCPWLPTVPIGVATKVIILQHPYEDRRKLQTARMLQLSVSPGSVEIWRGRKFLGHPRRPELESPGCALLYPSDSAVDAESLPVGAVKTLVVLDGTWQQANGMKFHNKFLHSLPHVKVSPEAATSKSASVSAYVIRTQPHAGCLCTAEAAALALDCLERRSDVLAAVLGPLRALCKFQMDCGALPHTDKVTKRLAADRGGTADDDVESVGRDVEPL